MDMNETLITQEEKQNQSLINGLITADRFLNRNYLINLHKQEVVPLSNTEKDTSYMRLLHIEKLVFDKKENINDKLISVYSALQNVNSTAILIINGNKECVDFYIGARSNSNATTARNILENSFKGNFSGSILINKNNTEIKQILDNMIDTEQENNNKKVACVTVVPSVRDDNKEKFVQGIEKFVDTMKKEVYSAIYIAKPVSKEDLEIRKRGYEELYSALSPLAKTTLAYGENYSEAVSKGMSENISHSVNNSISNTNGVSTGKSESYTSGSNMGINILGFSSGNSSSSTSGYSSGESWSKSISEGTTDTKGFGVNKSVSDTIGNSKNLTIEYQNKTVTVLLEKIDEQLKRIKECEAFGVWECAAYFIADDIQTSVIAANSYKALMLGNKTDVENAYVNVWGIDSEDKTKKVLEYIKYGMHPIIKIVPETGYEEQFISPSNYISGKELPLFMGIPQKSVTNLSVSKMSEFGRNVFIQNKRNEDEKIRLGVVRHMGEDEGTEVDLDLNSFTSHCFISGSTGSGKSNTSYVLLEKFIENNIPFLVIEPAKGEYKNQFGAVENINIFSTNPYLGQMLKINPFRFDNNIHILEHLDRLIEIFNACWEMYAAMPAILKDAIERVYIDKGWDLLNSIYIKGTEPEYPTFNDLLKVLPKIINESNYSSDTKGDYIGALVTRVSSLTKGIAGQIFCDTYDISDSILFDSNTIVDLSRVGSMETKSLIMGLLILKLSEYRIANAKGSNRKLQHITVIEEAHNLLKNTKGNAENNLIGKSVEMICNSIAEMRTYGEGFIIIDQSPTAVDIAAIKNTNTKIVMRLPEKEDCIAVGNAVGLEEEQIKEIAKLETGVAIVMQNNWLESVMTKIEECSNDYCCEINTVDYKKMRLLKGKVLKELMIQYIKEKEVNLQRLLEVVDSVEIDIVKRNEMKECLCHVVKYIKDLELDKFSTVLINIAGIKNLFYMNMEILDVENSDNDMKYSKESVINWARTICREIKKIVELEDNYIATLFKYALFMMIDKKDKNNYKEIYDVLYN